MGGVDDRVESVKVRQAKKLDDLDTSIFFNIFKHGINDKSILSNTGPAVKDHFEKNVV